MCIPFKKRGKKCTMFENDIGNTYEDMNGLSKTQKRRLRRKNKKYKQETLETNNSEICENVEKNTQESCDVELLNEYKVESPSELSQIKKNNNNLKKSKSLDDDDNSVKIQEVDENCENNSHNTNCNGIITEISEINNDILSPQEEQELRNFLESLNLVNSPEESAKQIYEKTTNNTDVKTKKNQNRKDLQEYFLPICQNPRYLEVISEESSDQSDKEVSHLKHTTSELNISKRIPKNIPKYFTQQVPQEPAKLIETKVLDFSENICSKSEIPAVQDSVEIVYIDEDSSGNSTPKEIENIVKINAISSTCSTLSSSSSSSFSSSCTANEIFQPKTLKEIVRNIVPYEDETLEKMFENIRITYNNSIAVVPLKKSIEEEKQLILEMQNTSSKLRLKAKNLNEWLNLAKSDTNLSTVHRRQSLPSELFENQLKILMEKEKEIQEELKMLENEKMKLKNEEKCNINNEFCADDFKISKKGDFAEIKNKRPLSMPLITSEMFRQQMYEEYMNKVNERQERRSQKVIKLSNSNTNIQNIKQCVQIEDEFMNKVKEKAQEGKLDLINDSDIENTDEKVPYHIKELMEIQNEGIWSPGQQNEPVQNIAPQSRTKDKDDPISPVWTPKSANSSPTVERKEFRPLNYQSPTLSRRNRTLSEGVYSPDSTTSSEPPWKKSDYQPEPKLSNSQSTPGFTNFSRLPKAQNPTITLLQKAREGQLPKGAQYIEPERKIYDNRPPIKYPGEIVYQIKNEYTSEPEAEPPRKMADLGPRKFEGVGPVTKDGMPLILRSEVKEKDQSKWYKRMYDTIHKQKPHRDEYVTIKYKQKRAQYPYTSGYLSEPEPGAYDSDFTDYRYTSLDRRREQPVYDFTTSTMPRNGTNRSNSSNDIIKPNNPPGRIENYVPGHSSISDKEAKEWWDEVMDIFDGHLEQERRAPPPRGHPKSFINQALRESGYESDSTLVFRKREDPNLQLSPKEQKEAYKTIQKGGDIPLHGLRKPAPEKPKEIEHPPPPPRLSSFEHGKAENSESPRKYLEKDVTIHYKSPVRQEVKGYLSEDELASRQADNLRKMYQEEKRRRYLQELQDTNSRRHTDNFIPSQKSPISLTRYDDFDDLAPTARPKPRSPEPRLVARALYNFIGQTPKELTFRKGDLVYLRRQIDKNWYEGELNAMVGLFPVNYVEIVPYESTKPANALITTTRKPYEGQARAKYNFLAQTHLELSLAKGELVTITRKVDNNWFEGKIGGRKGIFPVSYVEVLIDPKEVPQQNGKPVASPAAHSLLLNGSSQGKESMGSHLYSPHLGTPQIATSYHAKPVQISGSGTYSTLDRSSRNPVDKALHIDTQIDPTPYRALYKYTPQNDDELELFEGDTVYVLEKCDDGWFVGSSDRTGAFGTFPGNYVEKI